MAEATRTTTTKHLMTCPAECGNPIVATVCLDLTLGPIAPAKDSSSKATATATGTVVGLAVTHNCIPTTTRSTTITHTPGA